MPIMCKCRSCGKSYREDKATADWKGYCSQKCIKEKLRLLGYPVNRVIKEGKVYTILSREKAIGSVFV